MDDYFIYSQILAQAFAANHRNAELVAKKHELLEQVYQFHRTSPRTVLFLGFNPALYQQSNIKNYVLGIDRTQLESIQSMPNNCYVLGNISQLNEPVDAVVAFDEYFTFVVDEQQQRNQLSQLKSLTRGPVITSLRDYKNQDFRDREFSFPSIVRQLLDTRIYLEHHDHGSGSRAQWQNRVYEIHNDNLTTHGPFDRQTVYFKQLAKFAADAGFENFVIHKNLMYKSPIRKNYEHVISFA